MIVQKVHYGLQARKLEQSERMARDVLNEFLFGDMPEIDPVLQPEEYMNALEPHLIRLQDGLRRIAGNRKRRRTAMRAVMLDVSSNIKGEFKARLMAAFQWLGYVDEEIRMTSSPNWWMRARACTHLRLMKAEAASERLEILLNDVNEDVRIEAAQSLVDIVGVAALSLVLVTITDISPWMEIRLSRSIINFGSDAVPHLAKGLTSKSAKVQRFCMDMLGNIGDVYAVPIILEHIDKDIPEVRLAGIVALGKLGDGRAIPLIISYANSDDEQVRHAAAKSMGNLSSPATADVLNKLLLKDTIDIRLVAAESLTKLGEMGIKTLSYSTHSDDPQTRLVAYQYLHEMGYPIPEEEA